MKIVTVVGARPQFIKAATVSRAICKWNTRETGAPIEEIIVHTGQHYDPTMSQAFFDDLDIPAPRYHFNVNGGTHGEMTGRMLADIERVLVAERPDWTLVYGDTNSTLAGAIAAAKLHVPVAHVEAGLRSFNMRMPEEVNRIVADRVSTLLLCPTETAVRNLEREGIVNGVHNIGDVMYDAALFYKAKAAEQIGIMQQLRLTAGNFILSTCHRAENTDDLERLHEILLALNHLADMAPVVLALHPRTRKVIHAQGLTKYFEKLIVTDPLPFLDMVQLEQAAKLIVTDSGGVQKEAYFYGVPCVTMRDETEWVETVTMGWNRLTGANALNIITAAKALLQRPLTERPNLYGDGYSAEKVRDTLLGL